MSKKVFSRILMAALFATGLSGIVAEYMLATLATYFLGNSVLQWTLILSFMLFSMGLGSRISKYFEKNLIVKFITVEFILSILVSICTLVTYTTMSFSHSIWFVIYFFAIAIGLLIGMEIPLVTRINSEYKDLKLNISGVMEKDYYGSLLGGIFFAFVGLPFLGLTYTPFVLGGVNFIVALAVLFTFRNLITKKFNFSLNITALVVIVGLVLSVYFAKPIVKFGEQKRYVDKVIFSEETKFQKITITEYRNKYWLYLDAHTQLSSFDEYLYHEPLVHPAMGLVTNPKNVLVLGGGDGCALREVLKYSSVDSVLLVDIDPVMTDLGANHYVLNELNKNSYHNSKVQVVNQDAFKFLEVSNQYFDAIIIDFPDPRSIELNRLYTLEFYKLVNRRLRPHGIMVTQAGSPYVTTATFRSIEKTVQTAGFNVLPIHNHVYSFGEWGWVIGSKYIPDGVMKDKIRNMDINHIETKWLNKDALNLITTFGPDLFQFDTIEVNSIHNPVAFKYYEMAMFMGL